MAKHVMQDLINTGKVTRGALGVLIGPVTDDFAKEFHAPDTSGAFVQDVTAGGPADKAGLKYGDIIRKLNGESIGDNAQLKAKVTEMNPGTQVTLDILRDGKPMTVRVTLGELPANLAAQGGPRGTSPGPTEGTLKGIEVQNLTPSMRDQLQLPENVKGVVISQIDPNSPAGQLGLQQGDVIESINRQPVNNAVEFNRLAAVNSSLSTRAETTAAATTISKPSRLVRGRWAYPWARRRLAVPDGAALSVLKRDSSLIIGLLDYSFSFV